MKLYIFTLLAIFILISCNEKIEPNEQISNDLTYEILLVQANSYKIRTDEMYYEYFGILPDTSKRFPVNGANLDQAISLCEKCYVMLKDISDKINWEEEVDIVQWQKQYNMCKKEYVLFIFNHIHLNGFYHNPWHFEKYKKKFLKTNKTFHLIDLEKKPKNTYLYEIEMEKVNIAALLLEAQCYLYSFDFNKFID